MGSCFVGAAGLVPPWDKPKVGSDVTGIAEAVWIFNTQNEGQGGDRADGGDLLEPKGIRVVVLGSLGDLFFVFFDLGGKGLEGFEAGIDRGLKFGMLVEICCCFFMKARGGSSRDAVPERFENPPDGGNNVDSLPNEGVTKFDTHEVFLSLFGAVFNGAEQGRVDA